MKAETLAALQDARANRRMLALATRLSDAAETLVYPDKVEGALADDQALVAAARTDANLVPPMLAAARVEATLGEICGALRAEWGAYVEPAAF